MRTGKTPQHKSTYTINTRLCHRGSNPAPASSHPVPEPLFRHWSDPLVRLAVQSDGGEGSGGGEVNVCRMGEEARASHCSALPRVNFPEQPWPRLVRRAKTIRLRLFCLGASNRIPIPRLLSLSILVYKTINFPLQSRELLHDRIHIAVNSLSLNADRSSHCFNHNGQPCEALDSCSRFLNSSITQGKA